MGKTILPNSRVSPRFAGPCTFCRFPRFEDVAPENQPLDWAVYGVPFDAGVTYRPGARFGPRAIREASQYVKPFHVEHGVNVCETMSIADAGDAPIAPYSLESNVDAVHAFARGLGAPSTRLLAVGGDHSIAYPNLWAAWERAGEPDDGLALVHFDAHLDTVDEVWGERWGHASPFRRAIEDGLVDARRMLSLGVRGPLNRGDDLDFGRKAGVAMISAEDLLDPLETQRRGPALERIDAFVRDLAGRPAYLTFDVDVFDPAFAPGTGTPCPGGLSPALGLALLRRLKGINLVGADVVEVAPDRDASGNTALLAGHVMLEILALDAVRRRG